MPELVPWFLLLHVAGAIIGFGPAFVFPLIGGMGAREPQHANFAVRLSEAISHRHVTPLAVLQGLSGIGLIWSIQINLLAPEYRWLLAGIALYLFALGYSTGVQRPAILRLIDLSGGPTGAPPPQGVPAGPPPGLAEAAAAVRRNGKILTATLLAIFFLMVIKPGL
jgi:hypothetical protein